MKKLTVFGDSIAVGQGVTISRGWVSLLANALPKYFISNASQNGSTTRLALERMPYEVQSHPPDILIVQFGLNDCNFWQSDGGLPRVSLSGFLANHVEIFDRAKTFGVSDVIYLTNHPTLKGDLGFTDSYETISFSYYEELLKILTLRPAALIADTWSSFEDSIKRGKHSLRDLLLEDGIHLSEKGHEVYFETVTQTLSNICIP